MAVILHKKYGLLIKARSVKYIKREKVNGKWKYYYKDGNKSGKETAHSQISDYDIMVKKNNNAINSIINIYAVENLDRIIKDDKLSLQDKEMEIKNQKERMTTRYEQFCRINGISFKILDENRKKFKEKLNNMFAPYETNLGKMEEKTKEEAKKQEELKKQQDLKKQKFIESIKEKINNVKSVDNKEYWYHYPSHRGEITLDKIKKNLKSVSSMYSKQSAISELNKFKNESELSGHVYYHGTSTYIDRGLKPSVALRKQQSFRGGGYGIDYYTISLSEDKNIASNFTGQERSGVVYPVLLGKNTRVIHLPEVQDSDELTEIMPILWENRIDAVYIGESGKGEKELSIVNPRSVVLLKGESERFQVYQKKKFENMTNKEIFSLKEKYKNLLSDEK